MAVKWYCKGKTKDHGPFTFQDLVKFIRAGKLTEDHFVKQEYSARWQRVRDVVGLLDVAARPEGHEYAVPTRQRQDDSDHQVEPSVSAADAALVGLQQAMSTLDEVYPPPKRKRLVTRGRVVCGAAAVVLLVATTAMILQTRENRRFPQSAADEGQQREYTLELLRRLSPPTATIPGLQVGVPEFVPGLENVGDIYCFSLSFDLKTLVFSGAETIQDTHNLCIASRKSLLVPFGEPVRIDACSSDTWDINPCLSADGLELIFMRPQNREHFFWSTRAGIHAEFGPPAPWPKRGLDSTLYKAGYARLLDTDRLIFNAETEGHRNFIFMAKRKGPGKPFDTPKLAYLFLTEARSIVSADGMRSYFGTTDGLFLSGRQSEKEGFSRGFKLLGAETTGPIENPIWVAPQEDVIFYCSPGPEKEPGTARKAWMVRI